MADAIPKESVDNEGDWETDSDDSSESGDTAVIHIEYKKDEDQDPEEVLFDHLFHPASYVPRPLPPIPTMTNPSVPKPGPAKLSPNAGLDEWLAEAKQCHYLPEPVMKQLCEMVKECLMEGKLSSKGGTGSRAY